MLDAGLAARESVVYLELLEADADVENFATGWFVDEGVIATNAHNVVGGGGKIEVSGYLPNSAVLEATVAGYVEETMPDVAILETDYADASVLSLREDADLETGDPLVMVGNPCGVGNWVVAVGRFAGRSPPSIPTEDDDVEYTDLTSSVPTWRGSSGSPVLNLDDRVAGMTHGTESVALRRYGEQAPVAPDVVFTDRQTPSTLVCTTTWTSSSNSSTGGSETLGAAD